MSESTYFFRRFPFSSTLRINRSTSYFVYRLRSSRCPNADVAGKSTATTASVRYNLLLIVAPPFLDPDWTGANYHDGCEAHKESAGPHSEDATAAVASLRHRGFAI